MTEITWIETDSEQPEPDALPADRVVIASAKSDRERYHTSACRAFEKMRNPQVVDLKHAESIGATECAYCSGEASQLDGSQRNGGATAITEFRIKQVIAAIEASAHGLTRSELAAETGIREGCLRTPLEYARDRGQVKCVGQRYLLCESAADSGGVVADD